MTFAPTDAASPPLGFSTLQITLHWLIALIVLFQLVFGESMTVAVDAVAKGGAASMWDQNLATLHYWAGLGVLVLVAIRLALRWIHGVPPERASVPEWMALAARASHWLFYALLVAVPVTGLLGYYVGAPFGDIHAWAKPLFIGLIALHAAAALFHQFWLRDGLLGRMIIPGRS